MHCSLSNGIKAEHHRTLENESRLVILYYNTISKKFCHLQTAKSIGFKLIIDLEGK